MPPFWQLSPPASLPSMSLPDRRTSVARTLGWSTLGVAATGLGTLAYALWEARSYRLRRLDVPVLPAGATPLRVLHISDLHLTPQQRHRQEWVSRLAALEPDLVIDTGDNLAHVDAVEPTVQALGRLLDKPGVFVWGSNDYYGPTFKNPMRYLTQPERKATASPNVLPWKDLRDGFEARGWQDLTNREVRMEVAGLTIAFRGTDDAHLNEDDYAAIAGPVDSTADVTIGVTHAPYLRVLDAMTADGHDLSRPATPTAARSACRSTAPW